VFDYAMVQNTFETDSAEAMSYINLYFLGFIVLFGLVPSVLIYKVRMTPQGFFHMLLARAGLFSLSALIILFIAAVFYANYAAVGRNNSQLQAYITPYKFINASIKFVKRNYVSSPSAFTVLDPSPNLVDNKDSPVVTILVVGETARAQSFSLNGYTKRTNLYTDQLGVLSFKEMASCGTATAVSLPCMFSRLNRSEFDKQTASYQQNLLDIISLAGADILWIDNNNGGCKDVCNRVNTIIVDPHSDDPLCDGEYCLDEALLEPLNEKLSNLTSQHTVIVLHMMGSHGPTYYKRYPHEKTLFLPDCQRSDIQNCSEEQLLNTYDNTIAYTDFVLSKIIESLQNYASRENAQTTMLYVSDHGESLGEKGMYLHGLPYAIAPLEQTHIPMVYWQAQSNRLGDIDCLKAKTADLVSHDNLFDIMMGITSVESTVYQPDSDIFANCRATVGLVTNDTGETAAQSSEAIN
jgi:lipid A ethanolaminephosphotransferase